MSQSCGSLKFNEEATMMQQEIDTEKCVVKLEMEDTDIKTDEMDWVPVAEENKSCEKCKLECTSHDPQVYVDNAKVLCNQGRTKDHNNFSETPDKSEDIKPEIKPEPNEYEEAEEMFSCAQCSLQFHTLDHIQLHKDTVHNGQFMDLCKHDESEVNSTMLNTTVDLKGSSSSNEIISNSGLEMADNKDYVSSSVCIKKATFSGAPDRIKIGDNEIRAKESNKKCFLFEENAQLNKSNTDQHGSENDTGDESQNSSQTSKHKVKNKIFKCDDCGKMFGSVRGITIHIKNHVNKEPNRCKVCGAGFTTSRQFYNHNKTHKEEKFHKCDVCGKEFEYLNKLYLHKRCHTGEKPYKCDICGREFSHIHNYRAHTRTHTGEKPYKCDFCGKEFSQSNCLLVHKRIHTGEKPYKCDKCDAVYKDWTGLSVHKRKHTKEKPYKCDYCGKGFYRLNILDKHKRKHMEQKPYKCDVCGAIFPNNSDLSVHKIIHTDNLVLVRYL